jgi:hypothetical protein
MVGEEVAEHGLPIAIRDWMLLPDQRIGGDGVKSRKVGFTERPQLDEIARQVRLRVEQRER